MKTFFKNTINFLHYTLKEKNIIIDNTSKEDVNYYIVRFTKNNIKYTINVFYSEFGYTISVVKKLSLNDVTIKQETKTIINNDKVSQELLYKTIYGCVEVF